MFYFFFLLERVIFGVLVVALNNETQERDKKLGLVISLVILFCAVCLPLIIRVFSTLFYSALLRVSSGSFIP